MSEIKKIAPMSIDFNALGELFDKHKTPLKRISRDSFGEIKDFSPGKWEEDEASEPKPLSFGQKAVGAVPMGSGVPFSDADMYRIKAVIAELIDLIDLRVPKAKAMTEDGFLERMCKDEAIKKLIDASRTAVEYIKMNQ